jgi:hypothetical protein
MTMIRALSLGALLTMALSAVGCNSADQSLDPETVSSAETTTGGGTTGGTNHPTSFTNTCSLNSSDLAAYPLSQDGTMTACTVNIVSSNYDSSNKPTVHTTTLSCTGVNSSVSCTARLDASSVTSSGSYKHGTQTVPLTSAACMQYIARAGYACGQRAL